MKNTKKKGFTLVELVIVIAVIAILAAVLIPTFTSVITRANQSASVQKWKATIDEEYVEYVADNQKIPEEIYLVSSTYTLLKPSTGSYTTYKFYKEATTNPVAEEVTKTYTVLDSTYKVYLLWEANVGYQVVASETAPDDYTAITEMPFTTTTE